MKKLGWYILLPVALIAILRCNKASTSTFSATNGAGGSTARFAIMGDYLYTVDKSNLKVFNIADAANPVLKNTVSIGFDIETIYPFKDKLFIGSSSMVYIYSIDHPDQPQKLSTAISPQVIRRCDPVVAKDSVAYATLRTNGPCGGTQSILAVYDIRNISSPIQKSTYGVTEPYGLGYADTVLYVCDRYGLQVFNIKNAYEPKPVTELYDGWYKDVIPFSNELFCQMDSGLRVFDIIDRIKPKLIANIQ